MMDAKTKKQIGWGWWLWPDGNVDYGPRPGQQPTTNEVDDDHLDIDWQWSDSDRCAYCRAPGGQCSH